MLLTLPLPFIRIYSPSLVSTAKPLHNVFKMLTCFVVVYETGAIEEEVVVAVANELAASPIVELKEEEVRARCFTFDLAFMY